MNLFYFINLVCCLILLLCCMLFNFVVVKFVNFVDVKFLYDFSLKQLSVEILVKLFIGTIISFLMHQIFK